MELGIYQSGISTVPRLDFHSGLAVIKYEELGRADRGRGSVTAAFWVNTKAPELSCNGQLQQNTDLELQPGASYWVQSTLRSHCWWLGSCLNRCKDKAQYITFNSPVWRNNLHRVTPSRQEQGTEISKPAKKLNKWQQERFQQCCTLWSWKCQTAVKDSANINWCQ